jgi:hypothetical protein
MRSCVVLCGRIAATLLQMRTLCSTNFWCCVQYLTLLSFSGSILLSSVLLDSCTLRLPLVATLPTSAIHCGPQAAQGKGELGALGTLTNHVYLIFTESGRLASAACLCTFAQQLHNAAVTYHRDSFPTPPEAGMVAYFFRCSSYCAVATLNRLGQLGRCPVPKKTLATLPDLLADASPLKKALQLHRV